MTTVPTSSGMLAVLRENGLLHARGVPYATAPRFGLPEPVDTPDLLRDATRRGPACPQDPSRLDRVNGPLITDLAQDEDCLVVSVTAPADASGLPVMVWLHGGAYLSGSGEAPKYDPDGLARLGAVVVNVSYRLGALGYLTPTGGEHVDLGLRDQVAALRWVRDNIAAFGGDPGAVTVFGQSAGGDSALFLVAAPDARGLFHRAVVQSAPLGLRMGTGKDATRARMAEAMSSAFGRAVAEPAAATTAEVLAGQRAALGAAGEIGSSAGLAFGPTASRPPARPPLQQAWRTAAPDVDLLIGYTKDDAAPFVAMDPRVARLRTSGPLGRALVRAITRRTTNALFGGPARDVAELWREAGGEAATYRFDWEPDGGGPFGATHCIELPFLFDGDWSDAPMLAGQPVPADLASRVRATWVDFARSGTAALSGSDLRFR